MGQSETVKGVHGPLRSCARWLGWATVLAAISACDEGVGGGPCTYDSESVTVRITAVVPAGRESCESLCGESVTIQGDVIGADGATLASGTDVATFVYQRYADAQGWIVGAEVPGTWDTIRTGSCVPSIGYLGADDFDGRRQSEASCAADLREGSGDGIPSCSVLDCISPPDALVGAPCSATDVCDPGFAEDNVLYTCSSGTWQPQP